MAVNLVIVGASIRAAAFSALRAGFQPAGADLFADRDLAALVPVLGVKQYPRQLSRALENWPGTDWLYTGALENYPPLVGQMAEQGRLLGNSQAILARLGRPRDLFQVLTGAGLNCPGMILDPPGAPHGWLRKPIHSAGGIGIQPASSLDPPRGTSKVYYQEQVAGTPASAVFLATPDGTILLGATRQLVGCDFSAAAPYSYCGSIGPLAMPPLLQSEVEAMGQLLAGHYSLVGLFGIDLVIDQHRAWFIELNPRYPASAEILERATGQSLVRLHVDACRGEPTRPASMSHEKSWGKAILFARQSLTIPRSFPSLLEKTGCQTGDWPSVADLPAAGRKIAAGRPVLTVFARADSPAEVEDQLRQGLKRLEDQLLPTASLATSSRR
jgi:predicted ATP-grasp superfamily ATP-dependent carboligase